MIAFADQLRNRSQKPFQRPLSEKLTISFSTYRPPPRGLTQIDFYLSLISSEVQVFHGFRSLIPFTDDPIVGRDGLTFKLNGVELHLEPGYPADTQKLTYVLVMDILGALGSVMKEKSVAALQFSVYPTKGPRWQQVGWGFIDRDPSLGAGATNRSNPLIGSVSHPNPPLRDGASDVPVPTAMRQKS